MLGKQRKMSVGLKVVRMAGGSKYQAIDIIEGLYENKEILS
jgi:hypothetical protein